MSVQVNCIDAMANNTIVSIAVLGPDGAGKSTLLSILPRVFMSSRKNISFHLFPSLKGKNSSSSTVTDPHAEQPWGLLLSSAKLIYFALRYNFGWIKLKWLYSRQPVVIWFDRYYQDMLADPKRYRMGAPTWLVWLFGYLIPKPDYFIILDVRPEVVRARRVEVSEAESNRQYDAYRELAKRLSNAFLIDGNGSAEETAYACECALDDFIVCRLDQKSREE